MAKVSLREVQSLPDPLTSDLYEFVLGRVPGGGGTPEVLRITCQNVTLPSKMVEPVTVDLHSSSVVFAGRAVFTHDVSITFIENRKMEVFKTLNAWSEYCRNKQSQLGHYKADYSTTAELYVFDQMGKTIQTFRMRGVWISTIPDYSFDSSSANLVTVGASFQMDYWEADGEPVNSF